MIGKRYFSYDYGWGTVVAETDYAVLIEYDDQPSFYSVVKLENLFIEEDSK